MKTLHLTTYLHGGAGQVIVDLAESVGQLGGKAEVITSKTEYPGYLNYSEHLNQLRKKEIPTLLVDSLFKRDESLNEKVIQLVLSKLKEDNFDIIHAHASVPAKIAQKAKEKAGVTTPIIQSMQGWGTNKTRRQEIQDVAVMNGLDRIIAVSEASRSLLIKKGVIPEKIEVIPNGIEITEQTPLPAADQLELERLSNGRKLVGCIGTICERKNQERLVLAVSDLIKKGFPVSLVLIGEDELNGRCQSLAQNKGVSEFISVLGYRTNASNYFASFDIYCLPTLAEGSPLSVMESFAAKKIVVTSSIPELKEMVTDEINGIIFDPTSIESISSKLLKAIELDRSSEVEMLNTAFDTYQMRYSKTTMLESYFELYRSIIDSKKFH